ncbi:hypothetical protein EBU24_02260, partial [bacterium]|nr:hypothetical protein [bacterium]
YVLFLINSVCLNAAEQSEYERALIELMQLSNRQINASGMNTFSNRWNFNNGYSESNSQDDQYEDATALSETNDDYDGALPTDQNTVEIEETEPVCYLCAGECTPEEPYDARLRDYTCRHQFLHKTCSSDTPCDDENCCAHAMMKQWHIQGDQVLCPFKCAANKTDNYRDLLKKLKKPSYLEKQRNGKENTQHQEALEMAEINRQIAEFEANEQRQQAEAIKRQEEIARQEKIEEEKEADRQRRRLERLRVLTSQYDEENNDPTEISLQIAKLEANKQKRGQEENASTVRKVGPPVAPKPTNNTTSRVNMSMPIAFSSITVPSRFIHDQEEDDVEELLPTASSSNQNQNQDQSFNLGLFASHFGTSNKNDYFVNNNDLNRLLLSFGSADTIMINIGNCTENNKDFASVFIRSLITLTSYYKTNPNSETAQLITDLITHPHAQLIQKEDCPAGSLSKLVAQAPIQLNQTNLYNTIKNFTTTRK